MSRIMKGCGLAAVLMSFAAPAAVQAQSSPVRAVVRFAPTVGAGRRIAAVEGAGGRVVRIEPRTVTARMSRASADALRSAMGVVSVTIRR